MTGEVAGIPRATINERLRAVSCRDLGGGAHLLDRSPELGGVIAALRRLPPEPDPAWSRLDLISGNLILPPLAPVSSTLALRGF
jgi:hypothetical protein